MQVLSRLSEMTLICDDCLQQLVSSYLFHEKLSKSNAQIAQSYDRCKQLEDNMPNLVDDSSQFSLSSFRSIEVELPEQLNESDDACFCIIYEDDAKVHKDDYGNDETANECNDLLPLTTKASQACTKLIADSQCLSNQQRLSSSFRQLPQDAALVVTHFISSSCAKPNASLSNALAAQNNEMRTIDQAAIEINGQNYKNVLDIQPIDKELSANAIYSCKYCPMAYSSPHFLRNHLRKNHACKHCLQAFAKIGDLQRHIRQEHQQYKCAICLKEFKRNSSLRMHLKNLHGLELPAQVALLDYRIPAENQHAETTETETFAAEAVANSVR